MRSRRLGSVCRRIARQGILCLRILVEPALEDGPFYLSTFGLMRLLILFLILLSGGLVAPCAAAQPTDPPPRADSSDVASVDATLAALYDVISGPSEEERDWDRFRSLFVPGARLLPMNPQTGLPSVITPSEYAEQSAVAFRDSPLFQGKGFYESEVARRVERWGSIAHVWSTYVSRLDPDEEPFMRGINSIQLSHDGSRWWIVSIFWQGETEQTPLPVPYLPVN